MRWVLVAASALVWAGCFTPDLNTCADNRICPDGWRCTADGCLSPGQLVACAAPKVDGDPCTFEGADGACRDGGCIAFFCGDGVANGSEPCDAADLGGFTCSDLGYAFPDGLACTPDCRLDDRACTGRCGDGVHDPNEICDGDLPTGECVDFGFDVGSLRCSGFCTPGFSACGTIGWRPTELGVAADLYTAWEGGGEAYAAGASGMVLHQRGGQWSREAEGLITDHVYALGAGAADDVYAATSTTLYHRDATGWSQVASFTGTGHFFWGIHVSAPDDVWIVGDQLLHWDGAVLTQATMPSGVQMLLGIDGIAADDLWAVGQPDAIVHWDGTSWSQVAAPSVGVYKSVWVDTAGDAWAVGFNGGVSHWDGVSWSAMAAPSVFAQWWVTGTGPHDVDIAADVDTVGTSTVLHWDGAGWTSSGPPLAMHALAHAGASLLGVGQSPIGYTRGVGEWTALPPTGQVGTTALWASSLDDIYVGGLGSFLHWDGATWTTQTISGAQPVAMFGTSASDVWAVGPQSEILHDDGTGWTRVVPPTSGQPELVDVWAASPSDAWAAAADATLRHWDGNAWTPVSIGATGAFRHLAGSSASNVWAFGIDAGLWHYDGATWSQVAMPDGFYYDLAVTAPDDVWLVGPTGAIAHRDANAWTIAPVLTGEGLDDVAAIARDDVFVTGERGTVLHFDGTAWSAMRTGTEQAYPSVVAFPRGFVALEADLDVQISVARFERYGFWSCRASETDCSDGLDDDCDGAIDHADSDCP